MGNHHFKTRCASIILTSAGYGWAGGHYIPANSAVVAYAFQFVVIMAILIMGLSYISIAGRENYKSKWSVRGLGIFSGLSFLINIANIIHGAYTDNINSFGSHNTFADLVPIIIIIIGTGLWLITIVIKQRTVASM